MLKKISVFEEGFGWFQIPEGFETAEEAHPTEGWFNLLDGPVENQSTNFLWFVDKEHFIEEEEDEEEEKDEVELKGMLKQF